MTAVVDVDVLDGHLLLAAGAVLLEGRHLGGEGPREFIEGLLGSRRFHEGISDIEAFRIGHRRVVDRRHLRGDPVRCEGSSYDRYKRLIAICYSGSVNLNAELVRQGWPGLLCGS